MINYAVILMHYWTYNLDQTQQQKFVNWQGDAEFKGEDFTAAVTFGNPDVLVGSGNCLLFHPRLFVPQFEVYFRSFICF